MKIASLLGMVTAITLVALTGCSASSGEEPIRLKDIIEIRGYPSPPDLEHFGAPRPPPRDIKGAELKEFLEGYVRVRNEDAVGAPQGMGDAIAVVKHGE